MEWTYRASPRRLHGRRSSEFLTSEDDAQFPSPIHPSGPVRSHSPLSPRDRWPFPCPSSLPASARLPWAWYQHKTVATLSERSCTTKWRLPSHSLRQPVPSMSLAAVDPANFLCSNASSAHPDCHNNRCEVQLPIDVRNNQRFRRCAWRTRGRLVGEAMRATPPRP